MVRLMRRRHCFKMVATIRSGALIVQGRRDRLVRVEATRALAAARLDWRLEILDDIGHVPQLEAPDRFLAVVEPWLQGRAAA
jgi:pimeloyl-ACP methyl ester carboxylesterase